MIYYWASKEEKETKMKKSITYMSVQDVDENVREAEKCVKDEERRVKRLKDKMVDIKFDLMATRKAIAFWKKRLRELKKCAKAAK